MMRGNEQYSAPETLCDSCANNADCATGNMMCIDFKPKVKDSDDTNCSKEHKNER